MTAANLAEAGRDWADDDYRVPAFHARPDPPSRTDLRHVFSLLPRPRKPFRSTAVQETR